MKEELTATEGMANQAESGPRVVGIKWLSSASTVPEPVPIIEKARPWVGFVLPEPRHFVSLGYRFGLYCLGCVGRAIGRQRSHLAHWKNPRRSVRPWCVIGLLALATGFSGCVGYVGPNGGAVIEGPVVETPDVYLFGGYGHAHYAHAWSHRGARSRGWHR